LEVFKKILEKLYVIFSFFEPKHSKEESKVEVDNIDYAPFTYILTNDQLEVDKIVMSCDWSKLSTFLIQALKHVYHFEV
jgi:hypothetical protein